jgi:hypothetical protein
MTPKWMIWVLLAVAIIVLLLFGALVLKSLKFLFGAVIIYLVLTQGYRLFKPKEDKP